MIRIEEGRRRGEEKKKIHKGQEETKNTKEKRRERKALEQ